MFQNYLKTALRSLFKNKTYAAISIFGLAVGIVCSLFIARYVWFESSYDSFLPDSDRIYRVALERVYPERVRNFASSPVTVAPTLLDNYPEVETATRMHRLFFNPEITVQVGGESYVETRYFFADSLFFDVFDFQFVEGTPAAALNTVNKIVITDKTARRYFGDEPALNKTIRTGNSDAVVSGVIKDVPENSHMDFDLIGSIASLPFITSAINEGSWLNPWVYTYIKIRADADPTALESKFPQMVAQYGSTDLSRRLGANYTELGHQFNFFLQPLTDIHLHSKLDIEVQPTSNASYLYLLIIVAVFILALSCINFINLTTARSSERANEVGVRKVMGATRPLLIRQFALESILICFFSFGVAVLLALVLKNSFNQLIGQNLNIWDLFLGRPLLLVLCGLVLIGLIAGLYPSLVISAIQPATVLKGSFKSSGKGIWLRNALLVLQFFITITMISGTLFVSKQMQYLAEKDLGFDRDQLLIVRQARAIGQNLEAFKQELEQLPEIASVGGAGAMIGDFLGSNIFRPRRPEVSDLRANMVSYDDDFMAAMKFRILEGRAFDENFNDSLSVIINEAAARELGLENPVGEYLRAAGSNEQGPELRIIGLVEDYNFASLHTEVSPLIIDNDIAGNPPAVIAIRANSDRYSEVSSKIEAIWNKFVPDQPIRLSFLDQELNMLYEADQTTGQVFRFFTYVAIIIAFIGLFSLATYVLELRTKEICIRKILGASLGGIFMLLSSGFFRLVLVALALSIPLSYFAAGRWLERFAYHIEPDWLTFVKAGVIALILVLLAVGYQSLRIVLLNPAESLRSE